MASSRYLSYLLRHSDVPDKQGWIPLEKLILDYGFTEQSLKQIVANDEKHRYEFSYDGTKVRAIYGHSNHVHINYIPSAPPPILYHGTSIDKADAIMKEGLKKMSRQFVHLSSSPDAAIQVGKRHGKPVVIEVGSSRMSKDGIQFYTFGSRNIWLTEDVSPLYLNIQESFYMG